MNKPSTRNKEVTVHIINGWTISPLPAGFDFKYKVVKDGYEEKFYGFAAAERYALDH